MILASLIVAIVRPCTNIYTTPPIPRCLNYNLPIRREPSNFPPRIRYRQLRPPPPTLPLPPPLRPPQLPVPTPRAPCRNIPQPSNGQNLTTRTITNAPTRESHTVEGDVGDGRLDAEDGDVCERVGVDVGAAGGCVEG